MKIRFPERGRSGQLVVALKGLEFGFENEVITWTIRKKNEKSLCSLWGEN